MLRRSFGVALTFAALASAKGRGRDRGRGRNKDSDSGDENQWDHDFGGAFDSEGVPGKIYRMIKDLANVDLAQLDSALDDIQAAIDKLTQDLE